MAHTRRTTPRRATAAGLVLGAAADALLGDPARRHPVAAFGRAASHLERRWYADTRARGAVHAAALVGSAAALGGMAQRATRARPVPRALLTAVVAWSVLGSRSLIDEAAAVHGLVAAGDLAAARSRLIHLVGRDTTRLTEQEISRAAIESVAENTSDAVVAPLLWGATAGMAGMLAYRAVNTLDAMIGHRSARYRRFGWAAARLDDLANLLPARLTGLLAAALTGQPVRGWHETRRFARHHPSPNSGWCEAAFAAALHVRLGGRNDYAGRVEERPALGTGPAATIDDIDRAIRLSRRVATAAVALVAVLSMGRIRSSGAVG